MAYLGAMRTARCPIGPILSLLLLLASACGDGASGPPDRAAGGAPALLTLLPARTRAVLAVDVDALRSEASGGGFGAVLEGAGSEAALEAPARLIRRYTLGADLAATMHELVLAQVSRGPDGFLLVAEPRVPGLAEVFGAVRLAEAGAYRGQTLYDAGDSGLHVTRLDDGRLLVGGAAGVRAAIDTLDGRDAGVAAGPMGAVLPHLDGAGPIDFLAGLPALDREVAPRGPGTATLARALAVSGTLVLEGDSFEGRVRIHTDNAREYVARFNELVADTGTMPLSLGDDGAIHVDLPRSRLARTPSEVLAARTLLKALVHGMDAVDHAEGVFHGGNAPWMNFDVGGDPNSIFINFEFENEEQIRAFEARELPEGFRLAPLPILDTDEPTYFLVLNVYNSSGGLVEGARAEWSVFVEDPIDGHPRFLVVQAAAENVSADPVNLITSPEPVSHVFQDGDIVSYVGVEDPEGGEERHYFSSRIVWPQDPEVRVGFAREFVAANDFIYWGHGVADRVLYNASVHNREAVLIPDSQVTLADDSRWAEYVKPTPKHTYVYLNPLEIVISPWWNLDADHLDLTPEHRRTLIEFKDNFYPAAVLGIAEAAVAGDGDALAPFTVGGSTPSVEYNFVIDDPAGLEDALGLPPETRLAALRLLEGEDEPRHYLSLRVDQVDGRWGTAEWTVFVTGEDGRPHALVVDLLSEEAIFDPELLLRLASVVEHELADGRLQTTLGSESVDFEAAVDLRRTGSALPTLDVVEAGDRVCRRNGVCDKVFYDGKTMEEPVGVVDPGGVEVTRFATPWDAFVARRPASVFVRSGLRRFARNPWHNVGTPR